MNASAGLETMKAAAIGLAAIWLLSGMDARGTSARGPHGGYLKTSPRFDSELVLDGKRGAVVYLLNKDGQNPLNQGASLSFMLKSGRYEADYFCAPVGHHFECRFPQPTSRKEGDEITIRARRKGLSEIFHFKFPHVTASPLHPADQRR